MVRDLGCEVEHFKLDCSDLGHHESEKRPGLIVIVSDGQLAMATKARKRLHGVPQLAETPTLIVLPLARLGALDFSLGFEDFLLSPVVPAELFARIRQIDWRTADFGSEEVIKIGDLVIDVSGHEVLLAGRRIDFPHQEFELLRFLAHNRGRVYSREQLLEHVWQADYQVGTRTVDIHIRRVRAKLGKSMGGLIVTVRNVGYKMR